MRFAAVPTTVLACLAAAAFASSQTVAPEQLAGLKWRNIGPFRGGRVSAVTGVVQQPDTFYIGLPQGGVWKTTSAGQTWFPVFDSVKDVCSVGSLQVSPTNPDVVYAGTGEISGGGSGNGVYRSADSGKTWTHVGLDSVRMVPALLVDPHDPNLVLAAGVGAGDAGGVYRTTDGGHTWTKTLPAGKDSGVQHIAWAYDNPSVVFASTQRFDGPPDHMQPNGPAIYKSTDEGQTWAEVPVNGVPKMTGRFCVAVAQNTKSQRVFVIGTFGLYRTDDGGSTWRRMASDDSRIANGQGAYTSGVYVDPQNPDIVYTLATCMYRSLDGGNTFEGFKGAPGGDDPQQLWIDPVDRTHLLLGGDQGAVVSLDAGQTWGSWYNQPTGQVYHVSTDSRSPYWVYATQQDSGCIATSSRGNLGSIGPQDWRAQPGSEGGFIVTDPLDPRVSFCGGVYGGLVRVSFPTEQAVQVEPSSTLGARGFSRLAFSLGNPHELLYASQFLLATTDGGSEWKKLSPNLTAPAPTGKALAATPPGFAIITSFSTTPADGKLIWVGTSNGLIQVTKNHGGTWEDVSGGLPAAVKGARIACVEVSKADRLTAFVAISGGKSPGVYRTRDEGKTWSVVGQDDPTIKSALAGVSVLATDEKSPRLVFALTSGEVLASLDGGDHWQSLNLNLPKTSFSDIAIHGNDLVLGTFGRGIWILDDFSPLRELSPLTVGAAAHLFTPGDAIRIRRDLNQDTPFPPEVPHAENPPLGAILYYSLAAKLSGPIGLDIVDAHGEVVRHMSSAPIVPYDDPAPPVATYWPEVRKPMPSDVGLNRINWNIRYDTPSAFVHDGGDVMGAVPGETPEAIEGPLALPGVYTLRLRVDGRTFTRKLTVRDDPRAAVSEHDLAAEHEFQMGFYDGAIEAWNGYQQVTKVRTQLAALLAAKPPADVVKAVQDIDAKCADVAGRIERKRRFYGPPQPNSFVGLNGWLLDRLDYYSYGDGAPTDATEATYAEDWTKLKSVADRWRNLCANDLVALNSKLGGPGLPKVHGPATVLRDPTPPAARYLPKAPAPTPKR